MAGRAEDRFILIRQGERGFLTFNNVVLKAGDCVKADEIIEDSLCYYHDESTGNEDCIPLLLGDASGLVKTEIRLHIHILPLSARDQTVARPLH
jgi:hypothetical protein